MKEFFQFMLSLIYIVLVIAGIAGISYDLFRPEGWINHWLGDIWSMEMYFLMGIPVFIAVVAVAKMWLDGLLASSKGGTLANIIMGILLLAGLYYLVKFSL